MKFQITHVDEFLDVIRSFENRGNIYVVGAGEFGKLIGKCFINNGIKWEGFVDGYLKEPIEAETGKKICSYSDFFKEEDYFIVASKIYANVMEKQLKEANIKDDNILMFANIPDIVWELPGVIEDWSNYLKKIQQFHNLYQGQRCFIIGNGPSLTIEDLNKLKNEMTFACNSIYALYDDTEWRPTFYCAWDAAFCESILKEKKNILYFLSNSQAVFTGANRNTRLFCDDVDLERVFYVRARWAVDENSGLPLFSDDCSKCCYSSDTVTYLMLQLAVYMGFSEIYLLGIDMSYSYKLLEDGTVDYADSYAEGIKQKEMELKSEADKFATYEQEKEEESHKRGYMSAYRYAESHGIKIYNATRGGKLEVFERVELNELFKNM